MRLGVLRLSWIVKKKRKKECGFSLKIHALEP